MESWDLDCIEHIEEYKLMLLAMRSIILGNVTMSIPDQIEPLIPE
jgi:hypothetical protein